MIKIQHYNCQNVKIALVDSGIDNKRSEFSNEKIFFLNECEDRIGHGTAVASIISKISPKADIYVYKLFDEEETVDSQGLIETLLFLKQFNFNIIHLSCGVVFSDQLDELYQVCKEITNTGTIIVCAYDNFGRISYPAAFDNVIGVD